MSEYTYLKLQTSHSASVNFSVLVMKWETGLELSSDAFKFKNLLSGFLVMQIDNPPRI